MIHPDPEEFQLESVVHLVSPTGDRARNLEELREAIVRAPERALFLHVAGAQQRHPWSEELPPDDFSTWVGGVVQDRETAERLSYAVQTHRGSPRALRAPLLAALEGLGGQQRVAREAPEGGEFTMLTFDSVTVPTGFAARDPASLVEALLAADSGVWFYHLVEQPSLSEGPLLINWLSARGEARLATWLAEIGESGLPLEAMRRRLMMRQRRTRLRRRIAGAAEEQTESERREASKEAVEGLVRRLRHTHETSGDGERE